ncbi:hypothetical protein RhiirA4_466740 [Rhizophagus irregularis]|uniref:Uncharacterized protein n=1 Tax=Rhizophagus irregularis TaxID=588596 RepID=A0A2I1GUS5_9GLOM|nr:hypothetical protein RhiirA4_466740 [Rhizophagus irregularis]
MSGENSSLESWETIHLLNLFIGLLTNSIEIKDKGKYILAQKAEIIVEIELY